MANMSYCRWENTSKDMQDCWNALAEVDEVADWYAALNEYEQQGVRRLIQLSKLFVEELEPQLPQE